MPSPADPTPDIDWDALIESTDFHCVGQFTRGGETRIYRLLLVAHGAELWRITETPGEPSVSVRETHLDDSDQAGAFLEEIQRALKAGGWRVPSAATTL